MKTQILVAYASGSGSTAEVAEAIADVLGERGTPTDVRKASEVTDVTKYSSIVIGSSIRLGRWLPGAVGFVERFAEEVSTRPVAFFTTCLTMVDDSAESRRTVLAYLEPILQMVPEAEPVGLGLFAGSLNPSMQLVSPGSMGPYGDYRDWDAIRAWASEIRPGLLRGEGARDAGVVLGEFITAYGDSDDVSFQQEDMRGAELQRISLVEADLRRADLREADLTCAELRDSDLEQVSLGWANLPGCDLSGSNLRRSNLMGANLREANLKRADLSFAVLNGAVLKEANLSEALLIAADLNWVELDRANLDGADLSGASLAWASLREVNLEQANLKKVRYNEHTIWPDGFSPEGAGCIFVGGER